MDPRRYSHFRILFFLVSMPIGVVLPYLFLHLRKNAGFTPQMISHVLMLAGATIILTQQAWGYLADVVLSKRWIIAVNSTLAAILIFAVGQQTSYMPIVVLMFVYYAVYTPVLQLTHGFLFTFSGSDERFGALRGISSLGFVVINIAIAVMADKLTGGDTRFIFPLFGVIALGMAAYVLTFPEKAIDKRHRPTFLNVQKFFLGRREVAFFLVIVLFYQAGHSLSYVLQSFLMTDMGADMRTISLSYSLGALLEMPVFFAATYLIARFGEVRMVMFAAVVQAIRWLLIWASTSPTQIVAISLLHCITFAVFYAAAVSYMNKHAGLHLKASAQTILAMVYFGFGNLIGNYVGGEVTAGGKFAQMVRAIIAALHIPDRGDLRNLYIFCSATALAAALCCPVLLSWERRLRHTKVLGERMASGHR